MAYVKLIWVKTERTATGNQNLPLDFIQNTFFMHFKEQQFTVLHQKTDCEEQASWLCKEVSQDRCGKDRRFSKESVGGDREVRVEVFTPVQYCVMCNRKSVHLHNTGQV